MTKRPSPHRPDAASVHRTRWGTLYGVGLGPGDPELITLKAQRILGSVPTLLLPVRRAGEKGYAWTIAAPHIRPGEQRVLRLPFPGEAGGQQLDKQWDRSCEQVLDLLRHGEAAAFLTEGDPLLYSTFIQVASRLRVSAPDVPIEIVPGVSSITASMAAAGEPLVSRGGRLAILPAFYGVEGLRQTLHQFDTVVLLKVNRVLDQIVSVLDELDLSRNAVLVERCGRPEQRIVRGLNGSVGPVDYFSVIVVRK